MRAVDIGLIWNEMYAKTFPLVEEQGRVEMAVEQFGAPREATASFQMLASPPQPRVWFLSKAQTELVQIQDNWFARNWRRRTNDRYPHYPRLRGPFESDLKKFLGYARDHDWGGFKPNQVEFTYFNHIPLSDPVPIGLSDILTTVVPGHHYQSRARPEVTSYKAQFVLEQAGKPVGRLHVTAEPAIRRTDGMPIQVLNLTARGRPLGQGVDGVLAFLDFGHVALVKEFEGITRPKMHELWGKSQ